MGKVLQAITGSTKRIVGIMAHDFQRVFTDRKSTRLNSSHSGQSRMPSSA